MFKHTYAIKERLALCRYSRQNAHSILSPELRTEADKYEYLKDRLYPMIGQLASNMAIVGDEEEAIGIAEILLESFDADKEASLSALSVMAEEGSVAALTKIREIMGLSFDENGNTVFGDDLVPSEPKTFSMLLKLYKLGDKSLVDHIHKVINEIEDEYIKYAVGWAVKLYKYGDETAFELIVSTAKRLQAYILSLETEEEEVKPEDATDFQQMVKAATKFFSSSLSVTEQMSEHSDITLSYFVQQLLLDGDIEKAEIIEPLILSRYYSAWVSALRFELGYDTDGKRLQDVKNFINIFGEDLDESQLRDLTNMLVKGGDKESIEALEYLYSPLIDPELIYAPEVADALVALHLSGDSRAHSRLKVLITNPEDMWLLIASLEKMGYKEEATETAHMIFDINPNFDTAVTLLNQQYDDMAMESVQNGISRLDYGIITVVGRRIRQLGRLASHINTLEGKQEN